MDAPNANGNNDVKIENNEHASEFVVKKINELEKGMSPRPIVTGMIIEKHEIRKPQIGNPRNVSKTDKVYLKADPEKWGLKDGQRLLSSFIMADETSAIKVVLFGDEAADWYDKLQEGVVIRMTGPGVHEPHKSIRHFEACHPNGVELKSWEKTRIDLVTKESGLLQLEQLKDALKAKRYDAGFFQDVKGTVDSVSEVEDREHRPSGSQLKVKNVVVDVDSGSHKSIALWNQNALDFNAKPGDRIVITGVAVGHDGSLSNMSPYFAYSVLPADDQTN